MGAFFLAILFVVLFAFGLVVGAHIGDELSKRVVTRGDYWKYNLILFAIGVVASAVLWGTGWRLLVGVAFGLLVGAVSGLKMGFGESIGPWGKVDSKLGTNKDQVRRAKDPTHAEAVRRARKEGTEVPEVMSVAPQPASKGSSDASESTSRGSRRGKSRKTRET